MPFSASRALLFASVILTISRFAAADERSFASMLPNTVVAYVEFEPADQLLDHPLRTKIQASPEFLKIWRSPDVLKFRAGMTLAEAALGDKIENIARRLTEGGFAISVDRAHNAVALIAKTESQEWLDEYLERLITLSRNDAKSKKNDNPIKEGKYRDITAYQANGAVTVALGEYLVVANKGEYGKAIVDCYLDNVPATGLENHPSFAAAHSTRAANDDSNHFAWGFVDVQSLRDVGVAKQILGNKSDNFAAEMILGGLIETLRNTPTITAAWTLDAKATSISFAAPHDAGSVSEEREFFFGPEGKGAALPLLQSTNTLASLSAYRDLSLLWLRAGDLFDTKVNDQLAQAESTLTTLFSGRDFAEDILGAMQPEVRVVVERQEFDGTQPTPALRLPSFALVAQLRNPEVMQKELKRTFQSLIGFLNVAGAMNGQPQLDLGMESSGSQQFYTAQYEREVDRDQNAAVPIQFNFSPSLAFVNGDVILSSTIPLAKQLAGQLSGTADDAPHAADGKIDGASAKSPPASNTLIEIDAHAILVSLQDNRSQLVAQNMLQKGQSQEEADAEMNVLFSILSLVDHLRIQLGFEQQAKLDLTLQLAE